VGQLGGGVSARTATAFTAIYTCAKPYVAIQALPSGLVIGNCPRNTQFNTVSYAWADRHQTLSGYIGGVFNACGWMIYDHANLNAVRTSRNPTACSSFTYSTCSYVYCVDPNNPNTAYIWDSTTPGVHGVGLSRQIKSPPTGPGCPMYGNAWPWQTGRTETTFLHFIPRYRIVGIRYLTKWAYYDPSGSGNLVQLVMVNDFNTASGNGNWGFIPAWCLQ